MPPPGLLLSTVRLSLAAALCTLPHVASAVRGSASPTPTAGSCAADAGSSSPCCGQKGAPVPARYRCNATFAACTPNATCQSRVTLSLRQGPEAAIE